MVSLRALPAEKQLTKKNVLKFPAWADFVQRLPAGGDSLLHGDLCQLNLTFLLEQFMADIFLGQTEGSTETETETVAGPSDPVLPGQVSTE